MYVGCGAGGVYVFFNLEKIESDGCFCLGSFRSMVVLSPQLICFDEEEEADGSFNTSVGIEIFSSFFSILMVFITLAFSTAFSSLIEVGADFNQFSASALFADL